MAKLQTQPVETTSQLDMQPNGGAAAAILAAGLGALFLGLLTPLVAAFKPLSEFLTFYKPSGDIGGLAILVVVLWLICWFVIHQLWKNKQVNFTNIFVITLIMIALGLIGTFPPFFKLFGSGG